jgi:DDE superfamily endonuclease
MPKQSDRKKAMAELDSIVQQRAALAILREAESSSEDDSIDSYLDWLGSSTVDAIQCERYLERGEKYRKSERKEQTFKDDLAAGPDDQEWLNAAEFKQKYRMEFKSFQKVVNKIKDHPVFHNTSKHKQMSVEKQLAVFLRYVGTEGDGASNNGQRNTFCIGYGSASNYRFRVAKALVSLQKEYYLWPDENERKEISKEFQAMNDFPRVVGIMDGTLFPLAFSPQTKDAPDYSGRKFSYSLSVLIVNDHKRRIRHYLAGFPGSAHDQRVWTHTKLFRNPEQYFSPGQYLLGDSAFTNSCIVVSSYKKPSNGVMDPRQEQFNTKIAKIRITSEHTIGMLKARFPWVRSIRMKITEDPESVKKILTLIKATIVLHNMLIQFKIEEGEEEEELPEDWLDPNDLVGTGYEEEANGNTTVLPEDGQQMRSHIMQHCLDMFYVN